MGFLCVRVMTASEAGDGNRDGHEGEDDTLCRNHSTLCTSFSIRTTSASTLPCLCLLIPSLAGILEPSSGESFGGEDENLLHVSFCQCVRQISICSFWEARSKLVSGLKPTADSTSFPLGVIRTCVSYNFTIRRTKSPCRSHYHSFL